MFTKRISNHHYYYHPHHYHPHHRYPQQFKSLNVHQNINYAKFMILSSIQNIRKTKHLMSINNGEIFFIIDPFDRIKIESHLITIQ